MAVTFVVVPQWQGSPSSRAMRQAEGAAAIREDLPSGVDPRGRRARSRPATTRAAGIARFSSLQLVRERLTDALDDIDGPAVDDRRRLRGLGGRGRPRRPRRRRRAGLVRRASRPELPRDVAVGRVRRHGAALDRRRRDVPADRVFLAGARSWDPGEEAFAAESGIRAFSVDELADPAALVDAVAASGATSVYLHVDLDVLDPAEFDGLLDPEPFGLPRRRPGRRDQRPHRAAAARRAPPLAAYAPGSEQGRIDDAPTLLRIVGALAASSPR